MGADVNGIAVIAANTSLAAAAAAIGATVCAWLLFGKPDVTMALNGALSGSWQSPAHVAGLDAAEHGNDAYPEFGVLEAARSQQRRSSPEA